MTKIDHGDAITLEGIIRRLYNCDRFGISGYADADHLESNPLDAATLVIAPLYYTGKVTNQLEFDSFLAKYDCIFGYPEENLTQESVEEYISDLESIVKKYY